MHHLPGVTDKKTLSRNLAEHIDAKLKNKEVLAFMDRVAVSEPKAKRGMLADEAKKAGLEKCPFAEDSSLWAQ